MLLDKGKMPLRIALVLPSLYGGGAERMTLKLAKGLIDRGHSVDVLVFSKTGPLAHLVPSEARLFSLESTHNNIRHFYDRLHFAKHFGIKILCFLGSKLLHYTQFIAKYIDEEKPDCILPSLKYAKSATLMSSSFLNQAPPPPLIIPCIHSNVRYKNKKWKTIYTILFSSANHVITVSDGVADSVVSEINFPREKITRIYNPAFDEDIKQSMQNVPDHPWLLESDIPVILAIGRLAHEKDFPTLLEAFEIVARKLKVRLIIIGEGSWRKRLEKKVKKLNIESIVSLPGWAPNPYAYMSRASLFVLSSKWEGLSNVLIEALACGCPCVSTDCPSGPAEILDEGKFGMLVPVGDVSALAAAMKKTLDAPQNKNRLVARAKDFSIEVATKEYERVIVDQLNYRYAKPSV